MTHLPSQSKTMTMELPLRRLLQITAHCEDCGWFCSNLSFGYTTNLRRDEHHIVDDDDDDQVCQRWMIMETRVRRLGYVCRMDFMWILYPKSATTNVGKPTNIRRHKNTSTLSIPALVTSHGMNRCVGVATKWNAEPSAEKNIGPVLRRWSMHRLDYSNVNGERRVWSSDRIGIPALPCIRE